MNKMLDLKEFKSRKTDPEKLILAVKKQPSIWDSSCLDYKNKKTKQHAWDAVGGEVIQGWEDLNRTDRYVNVRFLIRRWNNIRDYFNKAVKANRIAKLTGEPRRKNYVFASKLKFLVPELEKKLNFDVNESLPNSIKLEHVDEDDNDEDEVEILDEEEESDYVTFVDTLENFDEHNQSNNICTRIPDTSLEYESKKLEEDADMMFLKSLLPDMKKLADDEKFAFKYAIMQAYMDIVKKRKE